MANAVVLPSRHERTYWGVRLEVAVIEVSTVKGRGCMRAGLQHCKGP